jgi:mono/diheme cytochrome c family protein
MSIQNWFIIVTALASVLFLSACNPNPQPVGLTPIPTLAPAETPTLNPALQAPEIASAPMPVVAGQADAALGAPVYLKHCSPCHGIEGQGVDAPALRNNEYIQTSGDQNVLTTIASGRPDTEMPAWLQANGGPLTGGQITNVVAYLHTLQGVSPLPTSTPLPPEPTETPLPPGGPTPEPARPSEPGGPGPAATLTGDVSRGQAAFGLYCAACHGPEGIQGVPNPDSDDGSVPALNPIDPTIVNPDLKVFATNVDLFIEHGSVPEGPRPQIMMPPFGDSKMLTEQQIADLIAYVIYLNKTPEKAATGP